MSQFTPAELILACIASGAVGILSGLFGVGGGFLMVPVLNIGLGIPIELAVGAAACQVLGPATTSILARKIPFSDYELPLVLTGGLFAGVFSGASVLHWAQHSDYTPQISFGNSPLSEVVVLCSYFVLLLVLGTFAVWDARLHRYGRSFSRGWVLHWRIPPYASFPQLACPQVSVPVICWFGLMVGFLAGLLGLSGGLMLVPGMIYLLGLRMHRAMRVSLVMIWIVAAQSTIVHSWHGHVDLTLVMVLLLGGTTGARLGSEFSERMGGPQLRAGFGWLLIGTSMFVGVKLLSLLGG